MFGLERKAYLKQNYQLFKKLFDAEKDKIQDYITEHAAVEDNEFVRARVTLNLKKNNGFYELSVAEKTLLPSLEFKDDKERQQFEAKCNEYFFTWLNDNYCAVFSQAAGDSTNNTTFYKVRLFCAMDLITWLDKNYEKTEDAVIKPAAEVPQNGVYYYTGEKLSVIYNVPINKFTGLTVDEKGISVFSNSDGGEHVFKFDLLDYQKAIDKYNILANQNLQLIK